jgi:hypothetical protein
MSFIDATSINRKTRIGLAFVIPVAVLVALNLAFRVASLREATAACLAAGLMSTAYEFQKIRRTDARAKKTA